MKSPVEGGARAALDGIHEFFSFEASESEICASGGAVEVGDKAVNGLCQPDVAVEKPCNDGVPARLKPHFAPLYTTAFGEEFLYHGLNCVGELDDVLPGREYNASVRLSEVKECFEGVSVCADRSAGGDVVALVQEIFHHLSDLSPVFFRQCPGSDDADVSSVLHFFFAPFLQA